jgi:8-oxo-dGTP pyrophosphatase MutT (NUDIX family)
MLLKLTDIESIFTNINDGELPGSISHKKMIPPNRNMFFEKKTNPQPIKSAIIILFYNKQGIPHIVYIKRAAYNGHHSSQVSFPGGKFDFEKDKTLQQTATRECNEEIGVPSKQIIIIKQITQLYIPVSNIFVTPFVSICNEDISFTINHEVDYIIEVPVSNLFDNTYIKKSEIEIENKKITVPYYNFGNEFIWGATAMITAELIDILNYSAEKK